MSILGVFRGFLEISLNSLYIYSGNWRMFGVFLEDFFGFLEDFL